MTLQSRNMVKVGFIYEGILSYIENDLLMAVLPLFGSLRWAIVVAEMRLSHFTSHHGTRS